MSDTKTYLVGIRLLNPDTRLMESMAVTINIELAELAYMLGKRAKANGEMVSTLMHGAITAHIGEPTVRAKRALRKSRVYK